MTEKRSITQVEHHISGGMNGMTLDAAIAWLQGIRQELTGFDPKIELEAAESGYDEGPYVSFRIVYWRPETDSEMAARIQQDEHYKAAQKARDLAQLKALKEKYGQ